MFCPMVVLRSSTVLVSTPFSNLIRQFGCLPAVPYTDLLRAYLSLLHDFRGRDDNVEQMKREVNEYLLCSILTSKLDMTQRASSSVEVDVSKRDESYASAVTTKSILSKKVGTTQQRLVIPDLRYFRKLQTVMGAHMKSLTYAATSPPQPQQSAQGVESDAPVAGSTSTSSAPSVVVVLPFTLLNEALRMVYQVAPVTAPSPKKGSDATDPSDHALVRMYASTLSSLGLILRCRPAAPFTLLNFTDECDLIVEAVAQDRLHRRTTTPVLPLDATLPNVQQSVPCRLLHAAKQLRKAHSASVVSILSDEPDLARAAFHLGVPVSSAETLEALNFGKPLNVSEAISSFARSLRQKEVNLRSQS